MMITKYCDFVLVVDREGNNESNVRQLSVRVLQSPAGESQTEIVAISLDLKKEVRKLEKRDLDTANIIALGEELGNLLLPNQARKLFINSLHRLQSDEGLRLRLKLESSLASIPWEYLYIPDLSGGKRDSTGFCALHPKISLVRHELVSIPVQLNTSPKVRRLLVALASPQDKGLLDIAKERENIESALKDIPGIKAEFLENATAEGLSEQLIPGTDIFHFAGHGEFKISELDTRRGFISLLSEDGKAALMSAEQLAMNLRDRGVQLVVLGACNTGQRDEQSAWDGVVAALIRVGIPAAVAMQYKIWDKSAIAFSRSFYKALAAGLTLDQAVAAGRLAVFNLCESLPEEKKQLYWRDWGVPVLYWRREGNFVLPAIMDESQRQALVTEMETGSKTAPIWNKSDRGVDISGQFSHSPIAIGEKNAIQSGNDNINVDSSSGVTISCQGNKVVGNQIKGDFVGHTKTSIGNISNSTMAVGEQSSVTATTFNQLPNSSISESKTVADWLEELKFAINKTDSGLSEKDREKAFNHLGVIAQLGQNGQNSELRVTGETALDALSGILSRGNGLNKLQIENLLDNIRETLKF